MKKLLYAILLALVVTGCSKPLTKEAYLKKFAAFSSGVSRNHKIWTDKEWSKSTRMYETLSGEWYEKFKSDLTWQEKVIITGYRAKFYYYKTTSRALSTVKGLDAEGINAIIQGFVDNGMKEDLVEFCEEARKAGGEMAKAVEEALRKMQIDIEDPQNMFQNK